MFRSVRATPVPLAQLFTTLPDDSTVFDVGDAYLVVTPRGVVVLTEDDGDLSASCARAAVHADAIRSGLADQLAWVPFVDAMCATYDPHFDPSQPCLVVPQDLVVHTLSSGPEQVDPDTLTALRDLRYRIVR